MTLTVIRSTEHNDYENEFFFNNDPIYGKLKPIDACLVASILGDLHVIEVVRNKKIPLHDIAHKLLIISGSNGNIQIFANIFKYTHFDLDDSQKLLIIDSACQNSRLNVIEHMVTYLGWNLYEDLSNILFRSMQYNNFDAISDLFIRCFPDKLGELSKKIILLILSTPETMGYLLQENIYKTLVSCYRSTSDRDHPKDGELNNLFIKKIDDFVTINNGSTFLSIIDQLQNNFIKDNYKTIVAAANRFHDISIVKLLLSKGIELRNDAKIFSNIPPSVYRSELLDLSLLNEIQEDEEYINSMFTEIEQADKNYHPSKFWKFFASINMTQLREAGMQSFKQTVNQVYYNYVPLSFLDPLVISVFLLRISGKIPKINDYTLKDPDVNESGSWKKKYRQVFQGKRMFQIKLYKKTIGLLIDYAKANDPEKLMERLSEPEIGNPIDMRLDGKLVSQDLANSVLEWYSILKHIDHDPYKRINISEIGAGYGRLASVFLQATNCKYVIFDIPPTLYVAQSYLSSLFKDKKIFKFRRFDSYEEIKDEFEEADIAFFTINQIEYLPNDYFGLSINISSFHEMTTSQITHITNQMSRVSKKYIYIKQYKKYKNPYDKIYIRTQDYKFSHEWSRLMFRTVATNRRFFEAIFQKEKSGD